MLQCDMHNVRLRSESRFAFFLAAAGLWLFLLTCALVGWYAGGRPPGWIEGKHLLGPMFGGGLLALVPSSMGLALAFIGLWSAGRSRPRRVRDWLPIGVAGAVVAALLANLAVPWGFAVVYFVSATRQGFWMD